MNEKTEQQYLNLPNRCVNEKPVNDGSGNEKASRRESRGSSWTMRSTSSFEDDLYDST
ncbi:serine/threonine-protein kinase [Sesbania bispinosa]|nr:serine/threonine-protein kinase [Sesbania bispinosa]